MVRIHREPQGFKRIELGKSVADGCGWASPDVLHDAYMTPGPRRQHSLPYPPAVIRAWPDLSEAVKAGILAMVKAVK